MPRRALTALHHVPAAARGLRAALAPWAFPILAAASACPAVASAQAFQSAGCGTYFCVTIATGSLAAAAPSSTRTYYDSWVGVFARAQSVVMRPALQALGATSFSWQVAVTGSYVGYCTPGLVCDRDSFSDYLSGGVGVPSRSLDVFGATPGMVRDWKVRIDSPVLFAAYDAGGHVIATDRFAAAVVLTPEPATLVLAAGGLVGIAVVARRRSRS